MVGACGNELHWYRGLGSGGGIKKGMAVVGRRAGPPTQSAE